jgi:hypothetical protein
MEMLCASSFTGQKAYNISPYDFAKLAADPDNLAATLAF